MPRRQRHQRQFNPQGQPYEAMNASFGSNPNSNPNTAYQNATESTHNGNFAWNGQPIPSTPQFDQQLNQQLNQQFNQPSVQSSAPAGGGMQQGYIPQARNYGTQTFQGGGMPVPGSSGNPNAPYGQRNTGINNADARNVGYQGGYTGYGPNGQPVQYGTFMRDGTQYGAGPHTIDPNKAIIQKVHYENGGIGAVQFQNGSVADIATAIAMAEQGLIEDVNTGRNREGQKTLRSYPDGYPGNNLSNLPRF